MLQATEALRITSPELVKFRIMDEIIPEPLGGAHSDPMAAFPAIKDAIMNTYHQYAAPACDMWLGASFVTHEVANHREALCPPLHNRCLHDQSSQQYQRITRGCPMML